MNLLDQTPDEKAMRCTERGSAYVITLMVLLILTVIGISLTFVTQTELIIGSQERIINSVFYAADGGLNTSISRALALQVEPFRYETRFVRDIPGLESDLTLADEVTVSGLVALGATGLFLCEEQLSNEEWGAVLFAAQARAVRMGADLTGDADVPLAEKTLGTMVQISPLNVRWFQQTFNRERNSAAFELP